MVLQLHSLNDNFWNSAIKYIAHNFIDQTLVAVTLFSNIIQEKDTYNN